MRQFIEINTWKDALQPGKYRVTMRRYSTSSSLGGILGRGVPSSHTAQVTVLREKNANTLEPSPSIPSHLMAGMSPPGMHTICSSKMLVM